MLADCQPLRTSSRQDVVFTRKSTSSHALSLFQVDGGRAIYADGPITLCDRADRTPGRGFNGRLAQLAIYDAALTESNVRPKVLKLAVHVYLHMLFLEQAWCLSCGTGSWLMLDMQGAHT